MTSASVYIINTGEHMCFEKISDDEGSSVWHVCGMMEMAAKWFVTGGGLQDPNYT